MGRCGLFFLLFFSSLLGQITNLTLEDAIDIALENNKPYLISEESQKAQYEKYLESISSYLPSIRYSGSYTHTPAPSLVEDVDNAQLSFRKNLLIQKFALEQPILSTDLIYNVKEQKLAWESSSQTQMSTKNALLFQIRDAYYFVLYQQRHLDIQKENVLFLQDALEVEEGRFRIGSATSLEVNQSKVAVTNALSMYYETLKSWKEARNSLVHILGINPTSEQSLSLAISSFPLENIPLISRKLQLLKQKYQYQDYFMPKLKDLEKQEESLGSKKKLLLFTQKELSSFVQKAFLYRPDLKVKKYQLEIAEQQIKKNQGEYYPKVTSFVDYTKNGGEPDARFFSIDNFSWAFGVKFSWNIFDSLKRERKIRRSKYLKSGAYYDYIYAKQTIETSIRTLLYQIEDSLYAYLSASSGVLTAFQAMTQAKEQLSFGKIPPLQYRDAVNQLSQAQNLKNRASYQLLMNYYLLRKTLGLDTRQ